MTAVVAVNSSTKNRRRTLGSYRRNGALAEDVFYFVENGGIAVRRLVLHFYRSAELFEEPALLAREFCWRENADVIIEVALAATAGVGETFAFQAKDGAALCAFGDFKSFFAVEPRDLELRAKSGLRDAQRDGAVQISPAALKEGMFLDLEDHVEIAWRAAVRSGFAFAGDAQARAGVHAGRNAQLDGFFALGAPLTVAIGATLANNLSRALACRARARDGKKTLLIGELAAAAAGLAGADAGA